MYDRSFSEKRVLITGGTRRLGRAVAEKFYSAGYRLKIHYNTSSADAEKAASDLSAEIVQCNFADAETESLKKLVSGCSVLINNASVYWTDKNSEKPLEYETLQKKINFEIPLMLMKFLVAECVNKPGVIINILDASALNRRSNPDSYYLSKYLLAEATKEYAVKLAPYIRVNGVAPGPVLPPEWAPDSHMRKSTADMLLKKPPSPEDIASAALFLAEIPSVTGEIIRVDSGFALNMNRAYSIL